MSGVVNERFFAADPELVFAALGRAAKFVGRVKGSDPYSRSLTFKTRAAGLSWGATFSAHVVNVPGGATVKVGGEIAIRTNVTGSSAEFKNTIRLLDAVSEVLEVWEKDGADLRPSLGAEPTAPTTSRSRDVAAQLADLAGLRADGDLSQQEFELLKSRLLDE